MEAKRHLILKIYVEIEDDLIDDVIIKKTQFWHNIHGMDRMDIRNVLMSFTDEIYEEYWISLKKTMERKDGNN